LKEENENEQLLLDKVNEEIIHCNLCPRLIQYIKETGQSKIIRRKENKYWAKPVPSFGDSKAKLLIIGLAPAFNGGNRTGRLFTGDSSGDWLVKALYITGFANKETSISITDGLILNEAYITAVAKCAPPQNKPNQMEILNCSRYLKEETKILKKTTKVILTLGKIAFDTYCKVHNIKGLKFGHNKIYQLNENTILISSYHPSRRNTNTGTLTWKMWINIFETARSIIDKEDKASIPT
jgi:uracil-DNA glycosylase family 4